MKVTRAGVDRSTNYSPDEFDTISVVLVGWDGEVGQGTVPIPDPSGNQEPYEGEQLLLEQDSLTILDGFLGSITTDRGGSSAGTRRVHTVTLADDNALLSGHATASWTRPAEAPAARWAAFVAAFLPVSVTTSWLLTTNESGITLPAKIYRSDSLFDDISADTIGPTGKTVYMEHRNFHWHLPTEGQTCSLSIHDTTFDQSTTFFPDPKAQRSKDGMDLRTKIYARNDAGVVVSVQDATAITRHEGAGLKHQGYSEYGSETSSEMTRDINVTLAERKAERTTWTYTIGPLTAAQVVELIPGSQITVTVALHDLSAAVKRIARVSLAYKHGRDSRHFMATLELGYPRRVKRKPTRTSSPADSTGGSGVAGSGGGSGGSGSGDCGCPPFIPCIPTELAHDLFDRVLATGVWGGSGAATNTLGLNWVTTSASHATITCDGADAVIVNDTSPIGNATIALSTTLIGSGTVFYAIHSGAVYHWRAENVRLASVPHTTSGTAVGFWWIIGYDWNAAGGGAAPVGSSDYAVRMTDDGVWELWNRPTYGPFTFSNWTMLSSGSYSDLTVEITDTGNTIIVNGVSVAAPTPVYVSPVTFFFLGNASGMAQVNMAAIRKYDASTCIEGTPERNQEVGVSPPEVVVMSGFNGTTAYPFADGSLRVAYDRLDQTPAIVSADGTTGGFVMASDPGSMQVTVMYKGR